MNDIYAHYEIGLIILLGEMKKLQHPNYGEALIYGGGIEIAGISSEPTE